MIRKVIAATLLVLALAVVPVGASGLAVGDDKDDRVDVEVHHEDPDCPRCPFDPFPLGACVRWQRLPNGGVCVYADPYEALAG